MRLFGIDGSVSSVVVVLIVCVASVTAQDAAPAARLESGSEWLDRCGRIAGLAAPDGELGPQAASCLAWVEGLVDINEIYRGLGALERSEEGFCMPSGATVGEAARAVVRYLDNHPSSRQFSARILAYMALREAFPCVKGM